MRKSPYSTYCVAQYAINGQAIENNGVLLAASRIWLPVTPTLAKPISYWFRNRQAQRLAVSRNGYTRGLLNSWIGNLWHAEFVTQVKLQPFQKALKALQTTHWISSVRAYQTTNRRTLTTFTQLTDEITKVHPMLSWTEVQMEQYLALYKLPLGPETFDPTKGESFRECGLHEQQSWSA